MAQYVAVGLSRVLVSVLKVRNSMLFVRCQRLGAVLVHCCALLHYADKPPTLPRYIPSDYTASCFRRAYPLLDYILRSLMICTPHPILFR